MLLINDVNQKKTAKEVYHLPIKKLKKREAGHKGGKIERRKGNIIFIHPKL
jgi:hypothetical protein